MKKTELAPVNEPARSKALGEFYIPNILPEEDFDNITNIAAEVCNAPIALIGISGADHVWFKSQHGLKISEAPLNNSLLSYTINAPEDIFVVPDLGKDKRFSKDIFVKRKPRAAFYAGAQLADPQGNVFGVLCVLDTRPRSFTRRQGAVLVSLAKQVACMLELRKRDLQIKQQQAETERSYADLEQVARIASHDLKSPLNNIISLAHLVKDEYGKKLKGEAKEYIDYLSESAYRLSDMISGIEGYLRASQLPVNDKSPMNVTKLVQEVIGLLNIPANAVIKYQRNNTDIIASRNILKHILLRLVFNAIQYNDKDKIKIEVNFHEHEHAYTFEVKDNGPGIALHDREKIFGLFERLEGRKKDGESMGIGLAIVKRLVEKSGGEIKIDSVLKKGSSFVFTIPK